MGAFGGREEGTLIREERDALRHQAWSTWRAVLVLSWVEVVGAEQI